MFAYTDQLVTVYLVRGYQFTLVEAVSGKSGKIRSVKCTGNIEKSVENCKKLVMFKRIYLHNC